MKVFKTGFYMGTFRAQTGTIVHSRNFLVLFKALSSSIFEVEGAPSITRSLQIEAIIVKMQRGSNIEHRGLENEDQSTAPGLPAQEPQNFLRY